MSVCKPGTTIIDALTLCYKAEDDFLAYMREVSESIDFDKFSLYRTKKVNTIANISMLSYTGQKLHLCILIDMEQMGKSHIFGFE